MNPFTPEELERLPKWAQAKVQVLQNRISTVESELATMNGEPSRVFLPSRKAHQFLKNTDEIRFLLANNEWVSVQLSLDATEVKCYASDGLHIRPRASNSAILSSCR
jgi:hypothetical protein